LPGSTISCCGRRFAQSKRGYTIAVAAGGFVVDLRHVDRCREKVCELEPGKSGRKARGRKRSGKKEEMEDGEDMREVMGNTPLAYVSCFTGGALVGQIVAGSPAADVRN
jgi:hypothetical protein